ncbi:FecR family protein [Sulfurimonas sp.]
MKFLIFLILSIELFANIGKITLLKGSATITRDNASYKAKLGSVIHSTDKIDTYKKSKLQIILNDDTTLTLGENTEYIIDSYDDKNNPHLETTLLDGLLTTLSGKIGRIAPDKFKLKTKTSLIGIRGTKWKTFVGEKSENSVCLKGAITIKLANKKFNIPAGYMLLTKDGKSRKFKTNMRFFNSIITKAQSKQKFKPMPKTVLPNNNSTNKIQIKNSNISSNVNIKNVNVSKNGSAEVGNIQIEK